MAGTVDVGARSMVGRSWLTAPLPAGSGRELLVWAIVAFGVSLRVLFYADDRSLYIDEQLLFENLADRPVLDFRTTLSGSQMAPPGFLLLERLAVRLPGDRVRAARFLPMLCGVASVFLMRSAARRFLSPGAVPIAVGLFAASDWLIYYSAEIKQYSSDLMLGLVALLLAAGPKPPDSAAGLDPPGRAPTSRRRMAALCLFGAIGVWFSFPLVMVLAGVGTHAMAVAASRREKGRMLGLAAMGLAWVASFAVCYRVSHAILDQGRYIWNWWYFAFLPLPPRSLAELDYDLRLIVNVFDSPADVKTPMGPIATAALATALAIAGGWSLRRRWPGGLYLVTAPLLFTLAASALHQYPFHGRLLIFLVPSVHLLVAQGAAAVSRPGGRWLALALGAFLLLQPTYDALWYGFVQRLTHVGFDTHGDLRPDLLDHLDRIGVGRQRP